MIVDNPNQVYEIESPNSVGEYAVGTKCNWLMKVMLPSYTVGILLYINVWQSISLVDVSNLWAVKV